MVISNLSACACGSMYVGSAINTNRFCARFRNQNLFSFMPSSKHAGTESTRNKTRTVFGSTASSVFQSGLVSEEEDDSDEWSEINGGIEMLYPEEKNSPWELNLECDNKDDDDDDDQDSMIAPKNTVCSTKKTRVHFLEETESEVLSERILELSRTNRFRSALELFNSMELMGISPSSHACNSLLSCLLRIGLLDDALRVFESMKKNELATGHSYSLILKAVMDKRGYNVAIQLFESLRQDCEMEKAFDVVVFNTMLSACGKGNSWVEAQRIWGLMKDSRCKATKVTYCLLVTIFVRCGQNELALDVYSEMMQEGIEAGEDTMQAVIGGCTKEGKWELALKVFKDMIGSGLKPKLITCNALINSLGKAGNVKLAFKIFEIMKTLGHIPDSHTWYALLCALYKANRYTDALQFFEDLRSKHAAQVNSHHYNITLMCCSKLGFWDRALQLLWGMETSAVSTSSASYNLVISACEKARKPKVALQVYERMIHRKCTPDTFTHLSLIRCCIWGSLWHEVEGILNHVPPDALLYNAVIQGMCLQGNTQSAKKLYDKMRKSGLKADGKTRAMMLQKLSKRRTPT